MCRRFVYLWYCKCNALWLVPALNITSIYFINTSQISVSTLNKFPAWMLATPVYKLISNSKKSQTSFGRNSVWSCKQVILEDPFLKKKIHKYTRNSSTKKWSWEFRHDKPWWREIGRPMEKKWRELTCRKTTRKISMEYSEAQINEKVNRNIWLCIIRLSPNTHIWVWI